MAVAATVDVAKAASDEATRNSHALPATFVAPAKRPRPWRMSLCSMLTRTLVRLDAAGSVQSKGWKFGQGWIRTSEGVKPADLQSAPFGHFGTYPFECERFI